MKIVILFAILLLVTVNATSSHFHSKMKHAQGQPFAQCSQKCSQTADQTCNEACKQRIETKVSACLPGTSPTESPENDMDAEEQLNGETKIKNAQCLLKTIYAEPQLGNALKCLARCRFPKPPTAADQKILKNVDCLLASNVEGGCGKQVIDFLTFFKNTVSNKCAVCNPAAGNICKYNFAVCEGCYTKIVWPKANFKNQNLKNLAMCQSACSGVSAQLVVNTMVQFLPTLGKVYDIDQSMCQKRTIMEELFTERQVSANPNMMLKGLNQVVDLVSEFHKLGMY